MQSRPLEQVCNGRIQDIGEEVKASLLRLLKNSNESIAEQEIRAQTIGSMVLWAIRNLNGIGPVYTLCARSSLLKPWEQLSPLDKLCAFRPHS